MTDGCPVCGAPLAPDARFCAQCGTPVAPISDTARSTNPYERPVSPVGPAVEWHAEDEVGAGGYQDYYPEDFPDRFSAETGRPIPGEAPYPSEPPLAYAAPGDDQVLAPPWPEPEGPRSRVLVIGGALLVGFLILVGLVYFLIFRPGSSPTVALPSAPASSVTSAPAVAGSTPPTVTTPPTPSQPAYPAVALPAGSTVCPTASTGAYAHVASGNTSTSCEFATAVRAAYEPVASPGGSVVVQATSPRTGKSYTMTCTGTQPVICTGGNNAQVIIYGGAPTAP